MKYFEKKTHQKHLKTMILTLKIITGGVRNNWIENLKNLTFEPLAQKLIWLVRWTVRYGHIKTNLSEKILREPIKS